MRLPAIGVFEGGGVRGIALTGAAAAAMDLGARFSSVVGTSAGAIVSALLAAGYRADELRSVVTSVPWPTLLRGNALTKNISMVTRLGFHSGVQLEGVVSSLLEVKGVETFGDLDPGSLRIVATDLSHGRGIVLPDDLAEMGHDPDSFPVARSVLMSASVPFVFEPVRLTDRTTGEELLIADGAMTARFPAQLVPRDQPSIGFRLRLPPDSHLHQRIRGPVSLATAVIASGITAREALPPVCGPLETLVEIVVDHESLDFDLDPERAGELFDVGYSAASEQLASLQVPTVG